MDFDVASLFFCPLCEREQSISCAIPLDNCSCLFCQECLTVYLKQQLQELSKIQTGNAFTQHYRPHRTGQFTDDEGATVDCTVVDTVFRDNWEKSEIWLQLRDGEIVQAPYWRVALTEGMASTSMDGFCCFACPGDVCQGLITKTEAKEICPEAMGNYMEAEAIVNAQMSGCIQCPYPECRCLIERLPPESVQPSFTGAEHGEQYRFRCAGCQKDFCGVCFARPYHAGLNCMQYKMPDCRYCAEKLDATQASPLEAQDETRLSTHQLKQLLNEAEADYSWCIEKDDFVWVVQRVKSVCHGPECRSLLKRSCTKKLPCGHGCCGVRNSTEARSYQHACLACFEPDCPHSSTDFDDCQICWESFTKSPCIQLSCRHLIHLECAREKIVQGFPGPSIGFNHLYCAMCGTSGRENGAVQIATSDCSLNHPLLQKEIAPILKLREATAALAMTRLRASDDIKAPELEPGGEYHGRPVDFSLKKNMFYMCDKCKKPYFGGQRDCQAAAENAAEFDPKELICGSCCAVAAGQDCPRHGTRYIEWKCRYCCEIACWFCHGNTHYCDPCHRVNTRRLKQCGGNRCPLKVQHPPPGTEFCLGCALCRHRYE